MLVPVLRLRLVTLRRLPPVLELPRRSELRVLPPLRLVLELEPVPLTLLPLERDRLRLERSPLLLLPSSHSRDES